MTTSVNTRSWLVKNWQLKDINRKRMLGFSGILPFAHFILVVYRVGPAPSRLRAHLSPVGSVTGLCV